MKVRNSIQSFLYVALSAMLVVHVSHANEEQLEAIKVEVSELEQKLADLQKTSGSGSDIAANIAAAEKEIAETTESFVERESQIAEKEFLLSVYQSAFRVVTTLERGASLGNVSLPGGGDLQNVVFIGVANGSVQLQTSSGLKTLAASELPASLASSFQLPPGIPALATSIDTLYSRKPEVAKTDADKTIGSPMAKFSGDASAQPAQTQAKASAPASNAAAAAPAADDVPDYIKIKERNDVRLKEIAKLRADYAIQYAKIKALKAERYREQAGFNSAKIKKSKSIQDKVFGAIDKKIAVVDAEVTRIKNEMIRIRSEFE